MQVKRIIVNFNPVFGLRNRRRGLKRFSCFSRKRTGLSKKKLLGVCTLTKVYQYAKEERFLFFEPCRTMVDICMELLLSSLLSSKGLLSQFLVVLVCLQCNTVWNFWFSVQIKSYYSDSQLRWSDLPPTNGNQDMLKTLRRTLLP